LLITFISNGVNYTIGGFSWNGQDYLE